MILQLSLIFLTITALFVLTTHSYRLKKIRTNAEEFVNKHVLENVINLEEIKENPKLMKKYDITDNAILVQGDMVVTKEQEETFRPFTARKALQRKDSVWPGGVIPYAIHSSSLKHEDVIKESIRMWENETCLTFPRVPYNAKTHHIYFKEGIGCYSHVGRAPAAHPRGQIISLGPGCAYTDIIAHEIGHALSFIHEHTRPDRDDYIIILEENVQPDLLKPNFKKISQSSSSGVSYDLNSLMHYYPTVFSQNGKNTIVSKNPWDQLSFGLMEELSFADIKLANIIYNCSAHCLPKIQCYNGGFVDKNCECYCPLKFAGRRCQQIRKLDKEICHVVIRKPQTLITPNYGYNIISNNKCIWKIMAPEKKVVVLSFDVFDLTETEECYLDRLEIRAFDKYRGEYYCGKQLEGKNVTSKDREMWLFFLSQVDRTVDKGEMKAFKARISFKNASDY